MLRRTDEALASILAGRVAAMQVCSSTLKLKVWLAPPKFLSAKSVIDPVARFSSGAGAATERTARDKVTMVEVKCMIVDF